MQPKVSVITVCYNSAATIVDTLRSVSLQSYPNIEHIIVDGGSTDKTLDIVRAEGQRVTHVVSESDRGIYDAMNKGIRVAQGEVIGFINSDDFYASEDALKNIAAVFIDPSVDACYGNLCYVRQDSTSEIVRYWRSSVFTSGLFARGWCPPHPTFFVRKNVFDRFGVFDLDYQSGVDVELMMRFMEVNHVKTVYIPEVLVKMRMGGVSNSNWGNVVLQNREIWRALRNHGLGRSVLAFVLGKTVSRCKQFLMRPV